MARKAMKSVAKKATAKTTAKKKVRAKKAPKVQNRRIAAAKKTVRSAGKSARKKAITTTKTGKGLVGRAVDAVAQAAAPLLPGNVDKPHRDS